MTFEIIRDAIAKLTIKSREAESSKPNVPGPKNPASQ
jgi:hypothetical protein